jgi:hypothetical protein
MNYKLLGQKLCECNPPAEVRFTILNDIWKVEICVYQIGNCFYIIVYLILVFLILGRIKISKLNRVSDGSRCLHRLYFVLLFGEPIYGTGLIKLVFSALLDYGCICKF